MKIHDVVELLVDLNESIKKGLKGTVLEILGSNHVEIEFVKEDGTNFDHEGEITFTVSKNKLRIIN